MAEYMVNEIIYGRDLQINMHLYFINGVEFKF